MAAAPLESLVNRSIRTLGRRFDRNPRLKALVADTLTSENRILNWALLRRKSFYKPVVKLEQQLSKHTFPVSKGLELMRAMSAICELENQMEKPPRKLRKEAWTRDMDVKLCRQSARVVDAGTLLISHPLYSLNGHRNAVCLVLARSATSCMGVVLDNYSGDLDDPDPGTQLTMDDPVWPGAFACTYGGPSLGITHIHRPTDTRDDDNVNAFGATPIFEKSSFKDGPFFCGGNPTELSVAARAGDVEWHCFDGFVSWDNGQLRREMAEGVWVACRVDTSLLFDRRIDRATLWQQLLQCLGGEYAAFASMKQLPDELMEHDSKLSDELLEEFYDLFDRPEFDE